MKLCAVISLSLFAVSNQKGVASALSTKKLKMDNLVARNVLTSAANAFSSAVGIQVERKRQDDPGSSYFECAPMSLLPNAYPKEALAAAQTLATDFNELVDRVSRDAEFLERTLGGGVAESDPFTAQILRLYIEVYVTAPTDSPANVADRLGIHRSDYMLHTSNAVEPYTLKQVELNTIAASFAGLSSQVFKLHRFLTLRYSEEVKDLLDINPKIASSSHDPPVGVPANPTLERIPEAISVAHQRYVQKFTTKERPSDVAVLFVVQEGESNTVDQRMLEFRLFEDYKIPVIRLTLAQAYSYVNLSKDGRLSYGESEIAVVYYRAGYAPTDYPGGYMGNEWKARLRLETSLAAKCPSLGYHLAGTKKVQQQLARPGTLEHFFCSPEDKSKIDRMRECFAGLYSLGEDATPEDLMAVKVVLEGQHSKYVLKPQREGGGYNFYGKAMVEKLREHASIRNDGSVQLGTNLAEFILMERLFPPEQNAILLRGGRVEGTGLSVSELGCYGAIVVGGDCEIVHNEYAGLLLRTKFSNVDEGGVASGFATLSSPYLC